jgi:hypothetical protein
MNLEKEMDLATELLANYKDATTEEKAIEGLRACREMFPTAFDRLLLLAEISKHYKHLLEAFPQSDLPAIFRSFPPTDDFGGDIEKLLLKLADSHCYKEFVQAEESGDIFKAAAKRLFDEHGSNISIEHVETALANL